MGELLSKERAAREEGLGKLESMLTEVVGSERAAREKEVGELRLNVEKFLGPLDPERTDILTVDPPEISNGADAEKEVDGMLGKAGKVRVQESRPRGPARPMANGKLMSLENEFSKSLAALSEDFSRNAGKTQE